MHQMYCNTCDTLLFGIDYVLKISSDNDKNIRVAKSENFPDSKIFVAKNFPDKARKARQFSNPRQMRIKGGFARFWIIQLHFLDDLDTF